MRHHCDVALLPQSPNLEQFPARAAHGTEALLTAKSGSNFHGAPPWQGALNSSILPTKYEDLGNR